MGCICCEVINGTCIKCQISAARAEGYAECTRDVVAYLRDGDGAFAHDPQECAEDIERGRHIGAAKKEGR